MKTNFLQMGLSALLAFAGVGSQAGPLRRADVPAEPMWLVHVDVDGLRPTTIGRYIQTEMDKPEAQAKLSAFKALFSFDLKTQLHGLTLYGLGGAQEDGVVLVYADFNPSRLVTLAQAAQDSRESAYKNHTIYSWVDDKKPAKDGVKPRTYAAINGNRVIFGQRENQVGKALDVLAGASPNLASSQVFPQFGSGANNGFIQAAARKMDFASADPNAAILKLSKLVRFQLEEVENQVLAALTFEAKDEDVAANLTSIAQGLVALMKLQKDKPETAKVAEALTLKQQGANLEVKLKLPAQEAIEMMKADAARKAARKQ